MRSILRSVSVFRPVHALGLLACIGAPAAAAQSLPTKALLGLESEQQRVRIVSINAIRQSQDPRARRIIEGMLSDSAPAVRAAAGRGAKKRPKGQSKMTVLPRSSICHSNKMQIALPMM